ncbi:CDC50/LEM3 family [Diaporthe sp. PMI_573]|nr:CDC50/LEM3 family [Diaporthaceae sp. PMI_573]
MLHFRKMKKEMDDTSRRPDDTPYKQQRMKSWEPILTPTTAIKLFLILGLIMTAIGGFWLAKDSGIRQIRIDYTRCDEIESYDELEVMPPDNVFKQFRASSAGQPVDQWKRSNQTLTFDGVTKNYTMCTIEFFLPEDLQPPVLYHYQLTNFLQNHREYINSRHNGQLAGQNISLSAIKTSECGPLKTLRSTDDGTERIIYPCGLIANSYFNDTFENPLRLATASTSNKTQPYVMLKTGIAMELDKTLYRPSAYEFAYGPAGNRSTIVPPPAWAARFPNGYHSGNMFNPAVDESFMVWMRNSAGSRFSKLAMRNDKDTMERGMYRLNVFSHFPAKDNRGSKSLIISTKSVIGYGNDFVGSAYVALGGCSLLIALVSALTLRYRPRRLVEHDYLYRHDMLLRNRSPSF